MTVIVGVSNKISTGKLTAEDFALSISLGGIANWLGHSMNKKDERLSKRVYNALEKTLSDLSDVDSKVLARHCNMALCDILFDSICCIAPKKSTPIDREDEAGDRARWLQEKLASDPGMSVERIERVGHSTLAGLARKLVSDPEVLAEGLEHVEASQPDRDSDSKEESDRDDAIRAEQAEKGGSR